MASAGKFHEVCEASSALVTSGGKDTTGLSHTLTFGVTGLTIRALGTCPLAPPIVSSGSQPLMP